MRGRVCVCGWVYVVTIFAAELSCDTSVACRKSHATCHMPCATCKYERNSMYAYIDICVYIQKTSCDNFVFYSTLLIIRQYYCLHFAFMYISIY